MHHERLLPTVGVVVVMSMCACSEPVAVLVFALVAMGCLHELHGVLNSAVLRALSWVYVGGALVYAATHVDRTMYYGLWVGLSDVLQYFAGKLGTALLEHPHHPFPLTSPKKTLAGYVGGMLVCVGMVGSSALVCSLVLAGMLGDLLFSGVKRHAGVKHFATTLGSGIGGLCDRFDSIFSMLWCMAAWTVCVGDEAAFPDLS